MPSMAGTNILVIQALAIRDTFTLVAISGGLIPAYYTFISKIRLQPRSATNLAGGLEIQPRLTFHHLNPQKHLAEQSFPSPPEAIA